jgi:lipid II:glycine glycyltransferase (peptidoglycan interpeptide bridge formation enzyme)
MLQVKTQGTDLDGMIPGIACVPWRLSYLLRLPADGSFRISNSHSRASIKWAINKAKRLGVNVRPAETEADLRAWYRLYLETMRQNAVLPRHYRFFVALWELLKPRGMMQLLLAEQKTTGRQRIIAGSIFLTFGHTVSYAFNGSRSSDLHLRPNDVIQWQAINEACTAGHRFVDFGEVPEGNSDLAKFKSKWGSEPVRLYRYYYPACKDAENGPVESQGYKETLRKAIWRRLPLTTVAWLGDRIYRYL